MKKLIFVFFALSAVKCFGADSVSVAQEMTDREDLAILLDLRGRGVRQVGGEPIANVIERARRTKIFILPEGEARFTNADGSVRRSARWELDAAGQKNIFLSQEEAQKATGHDARIGILTHETLGPADRNFANSSLLRLMDKNNRFETGRFRNLTPAELEKTLNQKSGGGTSGVGGGGDYRVQYFMDLIYRNLFLLLMVNQISESELLHITCYIAGQFDFDIDPAIPRGQTRSEVQNEAGKNRIKVFFSEPTSHGSFDPQQYRDEFAIQSELLSGLTALIVVNGRNACAVPGSFL